MSHTPFLSRAFDEVAKPFLKEFSKSGDDVTGESLKHDVTTVVLYANASVCESAAILKLIVQTSPDGVKWYNSGSDVTINNTTLSGRTVVQNCGQFIRVVTQYSGTGKVRIDALALEGIPK